MEGLYITKVTYFRLILKFGSENQINDWTNLHVTTILSINLEAKWTSGK
jgi:hypothetical protein